MAKLRSNPKRFNGDEKLKQILPKYRPSRGSDIEPSKKVHDKLEEIIPAPHHYERRKEVREDPEQLPRTRFRRKLPQTSPQDIKKPLPKFTSVKVMVVAVGMLILVSSIALAFVNRSSDSETDKVVFEDEALEFYEALLSSEILNYNSTPLQGVLSANKVQYITSDDIIEELTPKYNFLIEIIDVSDYPTKYTRSRELGTAISNVPEAEFPEVQTSSSASPYNHYTVSNKEAFLINSNVNIKVSDNEIHAAQVMVLIWR